MTTNIILHFFYALMPKTKLIVSQCCLNNWNGKSINRKFSTRALAYQSFAHAFYLEVRPQVRYILLVPLQWQSASNLY